MLPALRQRIELYADRYARAEFLGDEQTPIGYERYGQLKGLLWTWRYLHGSEEAIEGMAQREVEAARVRLGYVDAEGYAMEGAAQ